MKRTTLTIWLCLLSALAALPLAAEVEFSGPDISEEDQLLFAAETACPSFGRYKTLFSADLEEGSLSQLTIFPEAVTLINGKTRIQLQNRFGIFRSDANWKNWEPVEEFPAFVQGGQIQNGKISTIETSPNGEFILYLQPGSVAYGNLILHELSSGKETVIAEDVELSYKDSIVSWAPESDYFVYRKGHELYYYSIEHFRTGRSLAEEYRSLGEGGIRSVCWSPQNDLYYIRKNLVYRINSTEFFATSLYSELMAAGSIVGKLPFAFEPAFDDFIISQDGTKILLNKGGGNIFVYFLKSSDFLSIGEQFSLPYLYLPRNTRLKRVLWSASDLVTILTESRENGGRRTALYRFDFSNNSLPPAFVKAEETGVTDIVLSEREDRLALLYSDRVEIKDYASWDGVSEVAHQSPLSAHWLSSSDILIAGRYRTEVFNTESRARRQLALSQPSGFGFGGESGSVFASQGDTVFVYDGAGDWREAPEGFQTREAGMKSSRYRAYLEKLPSGPYRNIVMIRKTEGYGTEPLFPYPEKTYEEFPAQDETADFSSFSHGSRIRRREVSLVFNAVDSPEGLTEALNMLAEYDARATFFLNGEFIRRNPEAVREIAQSGHEVGSLFFTYFNMTDARYQLDSDFIKGGLARNEDEYFNATGRELSLLWHTPYYLVNSAIIEAAREMNYTYIGRDVDPLEWTRQSARFRQTRGLSAAEMVERIDKLKKPGSIIPIRLGKWDDSSVDYLFNNLDLLLNSLVSRGYEVVPVSTLMEHAR